jgi:hypothetical protein
LYEDSASSPEIKTGSATTFCTSVEKMAKGKLFLWKAIPGKGNSP